MVATRLAAAQAGLGHEVRIISQTAATAAGRVEAMMRGLPAGERLEHACAPPDSLAARLLGRGAARLARDILRGADFAHLHGVWSPVIPAVAAVARRLGVPYALVPHGQLDPWSLAQRRLKKRLALLLWFRRPIARATFLHMLNRDEERLAAPLRLPAPAEIIPNGVFLEEIDPLPPRGTFRAAQPAVGPHPYVLFLSRLHHKKGLDHLADAFALLAPRRRDVHLVVAGPDDGARAPFEAQVAAAGLAERVHVVGPLYGRDKLAAMVDASCFCLPSRQEGFSIAITEAMACGLPVVISDACHFPEVAECGAGAVVPLDPAAVAAALERLLEDPAAATRRGRAARELVASRFTWPRIAALTIDLYRRYGAGS
jgi:glycosyltransferase involved in cell wall biosynthesis